MVLVLCIGDLHVPHRTADLPDKFKALLQPGKIAHVLCTGNLCSEAMYDYLRSISSDVVVTQGDYDTLNTWPDTHITSIGDFKIGVCHGHQIVPWGDQASLAGLQRKLDVDILVTGHTHEFKAYKYDDRFVINPGTATGVAGIHTSGKAQRPTPSFVLMDISGGKATVYIYELHNGEVKVDKMEYRKP